MERTVRIVVSFFYNWLINMHLNAKKTAFSLKCLSGLIVCDLSDEGKDFRSLVKERKTK